MQLISTFSFVEISTLFLVIEIYIKMSEISNFWLSVLISQVAPYLMFILVSKFTHPASLVLSSQNAQCFYISAALNLINLRTSWEIKKLLSYSIQFFVYFTVIPAHIVSWVP